MKVDSVAFPPANEEVLRMLPALDTDIHGDNEQLPFSPQKFIAEKSTQTQQKGTNFAVKKAKSEIWTEALSGKCRFQLSSCLNLFLQSQALESNSKILLKHESCKLPKVEQ